MVDIDYMIKNDTKGYFGAFSKTGKNSAEILGNVRQKDRLLNPQKYKGNNKSIINFLKRNGYHNIYGDDEIVKMIKEDELDDSQIEEVEEEIDIFKLQKKRKIEVAKNKEKDRNKNKDKNKEKPKIVEIKKYYHRTNSEAYKFHDLHRQKQHIKREFKTPDCTKYVPNKDFVWKRCLVPPKWEKSSGRRPLYGIDNTKYYLNHEEPTKNIGHIFIDMDKQTMRGDNITSHDLRIITTKTFVPKNKKKYKKKQENNESVMDSAYSTFNKNNPNMIMKYENNYVKGKKKRVQSAVTSSTRPQTGHPKNLNTLTSNNSRQVNNTSNSVCGKNFTSNSKYVNSNMNNNLNSNSLSEEEGLEINSVSSSELNDSYNQFKAAYQRQLKSKNDQNENQNQNRQKKSSNKRNSVKNENDIPMKNKILQNKNNKKNRPKSSYVPNRRLKLNKNKIKGPDFDKIITREYYENLTDHGATLIPFSLPNFKQVRERPLTMVVYERPIYTKNKHPPLVGITPDMYNDIYKYLEYTNNHTRCVPPNFDKMKARPVIDDSPLPVYMKGTVSRGACETVNETSLKMNNFAEGKFLSSYTSFWPKKSFNKIVNLNLLRSDAFLSYLINNRGNVRNSNNYVAKSMKFYRKNYEDLLKEGMLSRFDNVTFKTIRPEIRKEFKNMDKFLEKFLSEGNKTQKIINKKK